MLGKTSNVVLMCVLCVCAQFSLERHGQWTFKKFFLHCVWILALFFPSFQLLFEIITTIIILIMIITKVLIQFHASKRTTRVYFIICLGFELVRV